MTWTDRARLAKTPTDFKKNKAQMKNCFPFNSLKCVDHYFSFTFLCATELLSAGVQAAFFTQIYIHNKSRLRILPSVWQMMLSDPLDWQANKDITFSNNSTQWYSHRHIITTNVKTLDPVEKKKWTIRDLPKKETAASNEALNRR